MCPFKSDRQRRGMFASMNSHNDNKYTKRSRSSELREREAMQQPNKLSVGAKKREHLEADEKFHVVMREYENGTLHSSNGEIVTDKKQAVAIAYSEARKKDPNYGSKHHSNENHSNRGIHNGKENKQKEKELKKGIRVEREHTKTIQSIKRENLSTTEAQERIAQDHIAEDPRYYEKLDKANL